MVDYLMTSFPIMQHQAILQILRHVPENDQNINQTRSNPVRYRPISVNIKSRSGEKAKRSYGPACRLGYGVDWKTQYAVREAPPYWNNPSCLLKAMIGGFTTHIRQEDGDMVGQRVYGNGLSGDSSSTLGMHKVIAAIQILAEWGHSEYREWFKKDMLKLLAEI